MKIKKVLAAIGALLIIYGFFVVASFSYVEDPSNLLSVLAYAFFTLLGVIAMMIGFAVAGLLVIYALGLLD